MERALDHLDIKQILNKEINRNIVVVGEFDIPLLRHHLDRILGREQWTCILL